MNVSMSVLGIRLVIFLIRLLRVDTSLFHEVAYRLFQVINPVAHLVDSSDNGGTHLVESMLLGADSGV